MQDFLPYFLVSGQLAGIVCYAIAILLRLETTHHWNILSIFPKPVKAVCLTLAILVILAFLITEGLIFSGMLQKPSRDLDTLIVFRGTGQRNEIKQFIEASPGAGKRISRRKSRNNSGCLWWKRFRRGDFRGRSNV